MGNVRLWLARHPRARTIFAVPPVILFILACATPAISFSQHGETGFWLGWGMLPFGWLGLFGGGEPHPQIGWYANPILLVAWVMLLLGKWKGSIVLGLLALAIGLTSFSLRSMDIGIDFPSVLSDIKLGIGAYLWLASMLAIVLGAALNYLVLPAPKTITFSYNFRPRSPTDKSEKDVTKLGE